MTILQEGKDRLWLKFTSKAAVASRMAAFGFFILMYTVAAKFQEN